MVGDDQCSHHCLLRSLDLELTRSLRVKKFAGGTCGKQNWRLREDPETVLIICQEKHVPTYQAPVKKDLALRPSLSPANCCLKHLLVKLSLGESLKQEIRVPSTFGLVSHLSKPFFPLPPHQQ